MTAEELVRELAARKLTVSTAESCTGGMLSAKIIDVPGASEIFTEGFVTYTNEAKMKRLSVSPGTLKDFGAVSAQCACEMAEGAARQSGADIALSTTGIAGPGGGTDEKPVGLVYIGMKAGDMLTAKEFIFQGSRNDVRTQTVEKALSILEEGLKSL